MKYPKDIYMSPRKAIQRVSQILNRCECPAEKIQCGVYKEEREALVAATVLLAIEEQMGERFWLQCAEYIQRDVDIEIVGRSNQPNADFESRARWQITEFESHKESFIDVVLNKLKPGYVPGQLDLIVNVRDKSGWTFVPDELAKELSIFDSKYRSVCLVCDDVEDPWFYNVVQLTPAVYVKRFNINTALDGAVGPDFIRKLPRFGKYESAETEYLLKLPQCPRCGAE